MSGYVWGAQTQFFFQLTPDIILDAVNKIGFIDSRRCLTLNSMENRVFEVEIENQNDFKELKNPYIIAKFYRPGRWSKEQILEEHGFLLELVKNEIPVIAPLVIDGQTLFKLEDHDIFYTVFPKKGGRAPDEMNEEQLEILGRMLARLHNIGETKTAKHRLKIDPVSFGTQNLNFLLENKIIPMHIETIYKDLVENICKISTPLFDKIKNIRIHGDCHWGNIISREQEGLFFIDFDDMLTGPAIQDIWLITPGNDEYAKENRNILLGAYESMRDFDNKELKLVEPLRALRFIHFSAWIAKRWDDPAFKNAFAHFDSPEYWDVQVNDLKNQTLLIEQSLCQGFDY